MDEALSGRSNFSIDALSQMLYKPFRNESSLNQVPEG